MGASSSLQAEIEAIPESGNEIKVTGTTVSRKTPLTNLPTSSVLQALLYFHFLRREHAKRICDACTPAVPVARSRNAVVKGFMR